MNKYEKIGKIQQHYKQKNQKNKTSQKYSCGLNVVCLYCIYLILFDLFLFTFSCFPQFFQQFYVNCISL